MREHTSHAVIAVGADAVRISEANPRANLHVGDTRPNSFDDTHTLMAQHLVGLEVVLVRAAETGVGGLDEDLAVTELAGGLSGHNLALGGAAEDVVGERGHFAGYESKMQTNLAMRVYHPQKRKSGSRIYIEEWLSGRGGSSGQPGHQIGGLGFAGVAKGWGKNSSATGFLSLIKIFFSDTVNCPSSAEEPVGRSLRECVRRWDLDKLSAI